MSAWHQGQRVHLLGEDGAVAVAGSVFHRWCRADQAGRAWSAPSRVIERPCIRCRTGISMRRLRTTAMCGVSVHHIELMRAIHLRAARLAPVNHAI